MALRDELRFPNPITDPQHEVLLAIVHTAQLLQKEAVAVLRPFGLTDAQYNVLSLLDSQAPNGWLTQMQLGEMLLVSRANITGLIDRLEGAGFVERQADPEDRRVCRITLTPAGRKITDKAMAAYFQRLHEVVDDLNAADRKRILAVLEGIRGRLGDGGGE